MQGTRDIKTIRSLRNVSPAGETDVLPCPSPGGTNVLLSERGNLGTCTSSKGGRDDLGLGQVRDGDVGQLLKSKLEFAMQIGLEREF